MALTEHIVPGRWRDVRPPKSMELKATTVLSLPLSEASAKIRTGDPVDDAEDYELNIWAGVLPLTMNAGKPVADSLARRDIPVPDNVGNYGRRANGRSKVK